VKRASGRKTAMPLRHAHFFTCPLVVLAVFSFAARGSNHSGKPLRRSIMRLQPFDLLNATACPSCCDFICRRLAFMRTCR
jgi:hypothetical protein